MPIVIEDVLSLVVLIRNDFLIFRIGYPSRLVSGNTCATYLAIHPQLLDALRPRRLLELLVFVILTHGRNDLSAGFAAQDFSLA